MKKLIALAAATVGMATLAAAQSDAMNNMSIRAGIAFPTTGDLNGGTFFGAGLDFDFGKSWIGGKGTTYLSVDWLSKSTSGTRGNMFPIHLNQKFWLQEGTDEGAIPFYGFIGVGATVIDVAPASTVLSGRLGLGAQVNTNFSVEGVIVFTGRTRTSNILGNHVGLYVGYKF